MPTFCAYYQQVQTFSLIKDAVVGNVIASMQGPWMEAAVSPSPHMCTCSRCVFLFGTWFQIHAKYRTVMSKRPNIIFASPLSHRQSNALGQTASFSGHAILKKDSSHGNCPRWYRRWYCRISPANSAVPNHVS